ncbi:MAG: molybdopterin molybdenumtransferase MoeA, partial [Planctomycetia bacterium]|nr:molybdopterin molybdenumtransferase MoeA [Planctomycetia bacterium]
AVAPQALANRAINGSFTGKQPRSGRKFGTTTCLCAYDLFAGRVVRRLGGRSWVLPYRKMMVPLAAKIVSAIGRVDYVRVKIEEGKATPIAVSGASILSTTVTADGFVLVERDREGHAPGESVEVWMYEG